MCHPALRRLALGVGGLVALVSAVSACGGVEQQAAKLRPLPEERQELREGEYRSEKFEPPFSFEIGEGWTNAPPETPELLHLQWEETGG
jgi:hypothetical protein